MSRAWKLGIGIPLLVIGSLGTLVGILLLSVLGPGGRLDLPTATIRTEAAALVLEEQVAVGWLPWSSPELSELGTAVEFRASSPSADVFVGRARASDAAAFLTGVPYERVSELRFPGPVETTIVAGTAAAARPDDGRFWLDSDEGPGSRAIVGHAEQDEWWIVVMNADGSAGLDLRAALTIEVPLLGRAAIGFAAVGGLIAASGLGVVISAMRTSRRSDADATPPPPVPLPPPTGFPPPRPDRSD